MTKTAIKKSFFDELNSYIPEIETIKPLYKKPRTKVILLSTLIPACSLGLALAILIPIIKTALANQVVVSTDNKGGKSDIAQPYPAESSVFKVSLKAKRGPFKKQDIEVAFFHTSYFEDCLIYDGPGKISSINKEQKTVLKLTRYISYQPKIFDTQYLIDVVYENHSTLYEHVSGDTFSGEKNFSFVDSINSETMPQSFSNEKDYSNKYHEAFTYITYYVSVESEDGLPLDYQYVDENRNKPGLIRSLGTSFKYSLDSDGIVLSSDNRK